jgi:alpha-tubulin suppressor-like RCC1 family protein
LPREGPPSVAGEPPAPVTKYPELAGAVEATLEIATCVRLRDGTLRVWNARELRGDGTSSQNKIDAPWTLGPSRLALRATSVTAGNEFLCTADVDGAVWVWGQGGFGQVGEVRGHKYGHSEYWFVLQPQRLEFPR